MSIEAGREKLGGWWWRALWRLTGPHVPPLELWWRVKLIAITSLEKGYPSAEVDAWEAAVWRAYQKMEAPPFIRPAQQQSNP